MKMPISGTLRSKGENRPSRPSHVVCIIDLQGGKPGCHFSRENVCPTLTKGRAACSDIHSMCIVED